MCALGDSGVGFWVLRLRLGFRAASGRAPAASLEDALSSSAPLPGLPGPRKASQGPWRGGGAGRGRSFCPWEPSLPPCCGGDTALGTALPGSARGPGVLGRGRQLRPGKGSPGEAGTPTDPALLGPPLREAASSGWGEPAWVSPRGISLGPLEGKSPPPPRRCVFWNVLCPPAPSLPYQGSWVQPPPCCIAAGLGGGVICPENKQTRKTTVCFLGSHVERKYLCH